MPQIRQTRLLIVEDHAGTAGGMKTYLELMGYDIEIARNAATARTMAESVEFDVLVCDLSLPDGNGWDLLKALQEKKPIRAIAYSAYDEPEYHENSKAAGFLDYVVKGSSPDVLIAAIERAFPNDTSSTLAAPERPAAASAPRKTRRPALRA
jgi:DNA-binding NarL/FixJ family response regulator